MLTEAGKKYANVETTEYIYSQGGGHSVNNFTGRTIHPNGTIIPFTGKPTDKLLENSQVYKTTTKVFTLPDVEVGSIIKYRYELHYQGSTPDWFRTSLSILPQWYVQSELYTRKAHYLWKPTNAPMNYNRWNGQNMPTVVAWMSMLPGGFEVKKTLFYGGDHNGHATIELNIHDIVPLPDEDHMPPLDSMTYRVLFYSTPYRSADEYWMNEGNVWLKETNGFVGPGKKVRETVKQLVTISDTPEQNLRKIYAAVMQLENAQFSPSRPAAEEKSVSLKAPQSTDEVLERKRGTNTEIAQLFVAMARAAGMKAYLMAVTNRDRSLFLPQYPSFSQLDDIIAIVKVDGKEQFFDPGERYCPYGDYPALHSFYRKFETKDHERVVLMVAVPAVSGN